MKSTLLSQILLTLHLFLLLRQSLLLLRVPHDSPRPLLLPAASPVQRLKTSLNNFFVPCFMQRIRQHGSGGALASLPVFGLLLYHPLNWQARLQAEKIWLVGWGIWATVALSSLIATRFQHFNGIAFSSRDAGPADFGRRWPFWPDGVLWLCELTYLSMLYILLLRWQLGGQIGNEAAMISKKGSSSLFLFIPVIHILFYYTLWCNCKAFCQQFIYKNRPALCASAVQLEVLPAEAMAGTESLYLLHLEIGSSSALNSKNGRQNNVGEQASQEELALGCLPDLPMGFFMLQFPSLSLPRWQDNDHPLSLLSQQQGSQISYGTGLKLEFALEMQGFLQYRKPEDFAQLVSSGQLRLWGPYYDAQPQFLQHIFQAGYLLYIGCAAGLSPIIQLMQYLHRHSPPYSSEAYRIHIAVLQLESSRTSANAQFWRERLLEVGKTLPLGCSMEFKSVQLPSFLEAAFGLHTWTSQAKAKSQAKNRIPSIALYCRQYRRMKAWVSFRTECESEVLEKIFQQQLWPYFSELCQHWQISRAELQEHCLYRGPTSIQKQLEQYFLADS